MAALFSNGAKSTAITGVDENGNKIGVGERLLCGALALPTPAGKVAKGGKYVAKYGDDALALGKKAKGKLDDALSKGKKKACACPTNVPRNVIKPNSPQWRKTQKEIKEATGKGNNFRVPSKKDAESMINQARPGLKKNPTYVNPTPKSGYEVHPPEPDVGNDLPHIKWYDWSKGKKKGADGHIFFERD
ncbi:hypothetical protein [Paludifilum halophilum]|uniref:hypothetical protein n=1 Tax=Paludifilum halophilum TaxID=1642702 RepID=UPI0011400700|nr:hypothetical protein [Paludifilum halophilum]